MDKAVLANQIKEALAAHEGWKMKLRAGIEGGALPKPAKDIAMDNQCSFGKWLNELSADPAVKSDPKYAAVCRAHAAFHREAGRVASFIEQGQKTIAKDALEGMSFKDSTSRLTSAMGDWQRSI